MDDSLLFCQATMEECYHIMAISPCMRQPQGKKLMQIKLLSISTIILSQPPTIYLEERFMLKPSRIMSSI